MAEMKKPRLVDTFPKHGNHVGDLIKLPSGQVYIWIGGKREGYQRWSRFFQGDADG